MENTSPTANENLKPKSFWKEVIQLLILATIIVIPFRLYIAQPFIVDGASMDPTFHTGDYLIIDELSYHLKEPARGEVLVFRYPKDESKYFIKRVIGLPGETVSIEDGKVRIKSSDGTLTLEEPYVKWIKIEDFNYTLGLGEYFVMGDNRKGSSDSRVWGPVPEDNIVGRPILRFMPPAVWPGRHLISNTE